MRAIAKILFVFFATAFHFGNETADATEAAGKFPISAIVQLLLEDASDREIAAKYTLRVQKNNHWANSVNDNPGRNVVDSMAVIDLDDDGDDDLLVSTITNPGGEDPDQYSELELVIFRDIGDAYVMEPTNITVGIRDFTVNDFNGDGLQDIYIGNQGFDDEPFPGGQDRLLMQNGDGTLSDVTNSNMPIGLLFTHSVCSGDFDSDGDADLYVAALTSLHKIYGNDGTGNFTDTTASILPFEMLPFHTVSFQWCDVADFNLDGRDDLILGQQDTGRSEDEIEDSIGNVLLDSLVILYGSEQGALVTDYAIGLLPMNWDGPTEGVGVQDIRVADFNRDGCIDAVVSSTNNPQGSQSLNFAVNKSVYFGDCAGGFGDPFNYTQRMATETADALLVADVNEDGFPDFVNRYDFDPYIDGGLEVPPIAEPNYNPRAYIYNHSLTVPFTIRELTRNDVEQLEILGFLGLIHNSLQ